jgi:hypothetical protein
LKLKQDFQKISKMKIPAKSKKELRQFLNEFPDMPLSDAFTIVMRTYNDFVPTEISNRK